MDDRGAWIAGALAVAALGGAIIALQDHPWAFYAGLALIVSGFGGFAGIMAFWKQKPMGGRSTTFLKGGKIGSVILDDNQSSAETFVDVDEAKSVAARGNLHKPFSRDE